MKILIFSSESQNYSSQIEAQELSYDEKKGDFWMRCVMGDDWFQRVTSSLECRPVLVRFVPECAIVVFDLVEEADAFVNWLAKAKAEVEYGHQTMRG